MTKNKKTFFAVTIVAICWIIAGISNAVAGEDSAPGLKNITLTGYGSYETGQVVAGQWEGSDAMDHYWSHQVYAGLGFISKLSDRMKLVAGVEGKMWNPYQNGNNFRDWTEQHMSLWLTEASGTYSFGDEEKPWLKLTAGYFPYKYNPEVRNLGEYLFRSLTYPGLIFNSFDFPASRQLGFKATVNLLDGNWENDFMVLEQAANWPFGDFSLAYVGSYNIAKVLEIGAGIDFANVISVNTNNTTPQIEANRIVLGTDPATGRPSIFDSAFYTFTATKPMGRVTIDPKPLLGDISGIMNTEDLKLYGEVAVIGLKNYSYYFDTLSQRMPIMFGFYLPTFKLLDILNVEFEHYAFPLSTSYYNQVYPQQAGGNYCFPVPYGGNYGFRTEPINSIEWKWSFYAKKYLMPNVAVTLQFSHDHFRPNYVDGYPAYSEALVKKNQWMWLAKLSASL